MGNFAVDVVERAPADRLAIVELARDGERREWSFGAVARLARRLAAHLHGAHGARRGDTVLTLVGNQPEWVAAMVACFRQGYVVLPCNEQLRAKDLALRIAVCDPAAVVCDARN
jgi:acyl-coenzyme A synthetase/AMP-(fatty) acid ligase